MSAHANPDIVDDNLVFMYDTNDGKSYKGEPTENIFLNPTFIGTAGTQTSTVTDNWSFSGYTGDSGFKFYNNSTSPFSLKFPNEGSLITTGANNDGTTQNRRFYCNAVLQAGAAYTVSAWIYTTRTSGLSIAHFEYGGSSLNNGYFSGTSTHPNHVLGQWYYWEDTYTVGADYTSGLIGPVHAGSSDTIVGIQRFQIEKKSHATQFVNGTRSATQGLIDRTGTSTINISNASFDSNAQMTFDGTDDTINTGLFNGRNPSTDPFTIEAVVKSDITSGSRMWIDATSNGSSQRLYCAHAATGTATPMGIQGSGWSSSGPHDTDYHHYVIVMDGSVARLYNNGEAHSTKNYTSYQIQALNIGGRNSYRWLGDIPIFKLYNRALTAAEVLQNYNATKSRFQ